MKRRHYKKKYLPYKRGKFRLPAGLLIVLAAAVICFIIAVIIGSIFKRRLETEDIDTTPVTFITTATEDDSEPSLHDGSLAFSKLTSVSFAFDEDEENPTEKLLKSVRALKDKGYTGLSFTAIGKNAKITYSSAAVAEASGLAPSEKLIPAATLTAVFNAAKESGLRVSVVVYYGGSPSEELVIKELIGLGADEIVLCCQYPDEIGEGLVQTLLALISKCRINGNVDFGVALLPGVYRNERSLPFAEQLYNETEFVLIDLCDLSPDDAAAALRELKVPVTDYEARPLLGALDAVGAAKVETALGEIGVKTKQYRDPLAVEDGGDEEDADDESDGDNDEN